MKRIIIFASGSGSNAEQIIDHFKNKPYVQIMSVLSNNKDAGVFERCLRLNVPCELFSRNDFSHSDIILNRLKKEADYIILAGFLWKIPESIVEAFPNRIINIHPALLPKYGGKGMYGMNVHKAVKENEEKETGITIHFVNEHYDEGAIIFQASTALSKTDTPEDIAQKIHTLEYEYFPKIIEETILNNG